MLLFIIYSLVAWVFMAHFVSLENQTKNLDWHLIQSNKFTVFLAPLYFWILILGTIAFYIFILAINLLDVLEAARFNRAGEERHLKEYENKNF